TYCSMDCSYCILQSYFHPPVLQFFVNHEDMAVELDRLFSERDITRIGTGEFTDSLLWDSWTDFSSVLVPKFSGQARAVLELKTKTADVLRLKNIEHGRKTIIAWSLNADPIIRNEERRTASLSNRLASAADCESWGYPLAFHFDPLVIYDGCESDYRHVVEQLFSHVSPDSVVWISLGSFRFIPDLKTIIQRRFDSSKIIYGEFVPGLDGKMRYFKPLRIALYRKMASWIKSLAPKAFVYLCMEDDEVWQKSLGYLPAEHGGLSAILDQQARQHCGLD
ncbi:radical SAM protein, partial [Thermodesulfobacteriota bacterium]